jgi:Terminase small subunit
MPEERPSRKKRRGQPILTPKEQKFLKAFVKTGNQRLSALSAGYSPVNPDQSANCVMKQLRRKVPELLEHIGLHLEKVLRGTLVPGLRAKKTEFFAHNGVVIESREVVDHEQRGKYLDRYCKLVGLYGNAVDANSDSLRRSPVTVNLVIADPRVAEAIAHRLAGGQSGDEQPALDVSLDEYEGRPRSAEPL